MVAMIDAISAKPFTRSYCLRLYYWRLKREGQAGYLPEEDYVQMLLSVDVIVELTTRQDCLVCGAYEAVAAGTLLIVSDAEVLRRQLSSGTLFTDNTSEDLAGKINTAILSKEVFAQQMRDLKVKLISEWNKSKEECERLLDQHVL